MVGENPIQDVRPSAPAEGLDLVWGCRAIARRIGKSERQTYYLLENGLLPAKKIGKEWCTTESALHQRFTVTVEAA